MQNTTKSCRKAGKKFQDAADIVGRVPHLQYSMALCNFKQRNVVEALKCLACIIEEVPAFNHLQLTIPMYACAKRRDQVLGLCVDFTCAATGNQTASRTKCGCTE